MHYDEGTARRGEFKSKRTGIFVILMLLPKVRVEVYRPAEFRVSVNSRKEGGFLGVKRDYRGVRMEARVMRSKGHIIEECELLQVKVS